MTAAPIPFDEGNRLSALFAAAILDTGEDTFLEEAVDAVLAVVSVPIVLVSLIDEERQWFKAGRGLSVSETERDCAFCAHAILSDAPLIVGDAREDERFVLNPLVTGAPHVVAYLGVPIVLTCGARIGTVCAIDRTPRSWSWREISHLTDIASLVARYIDLRRALLEKNRQRYLELVVCGDVAPERRRA
jgi:GAF domain-containing protein